MSAPVAFCPQCHNEVAFVQLGNARRCPICDFQYEMSNPGVLRNYAAPRTISAFGIFVRFVLILLAIFVIGVGVLFVGCMVVLKGI
jgi:hypothetical protein